MSILKIENSIKNLSIIGMIIVLGLTTLVYSNHFSNPFFFDDSHTIETNNSITSLNNEPTDKTSNFSHCDSCEYCGKVLVTINFFICGFSEIF